jgi:hypothetical protein
VLALLCLHLDERRRREEISLLSSAYLGEVEHAAAEPSCNSVVGTSGLVGGAVGAEPDARVMHVKCIYKLYSLLHYIFFIFDLLLKT